MSHSAGHIGMRHAALLVVLAGCPGDDGNASKLFLALDGVETRVRLVEQEPPPF